MRVSVQIITFPTTALWAEEFVFWFDERTRTFNLDNYYKQNRKTKRHDFKAVKIWSRLDKRHDTIKEKPDVPEHVKEKCLDVFMKSIKFEESK